MQSLSIKEKLNQLCNENVEDLIFHNLAFDSLNEEPLDRLNVFIIKDGERTPLKHISFSKEELFQFLNISNDLSNIIIHGKIGNFCRFMFNRFCIENENAMPKFRNEETVWLRKGLDFFDGKTHVVNDVAHVEKHEKNIEFNKRLKKEVEEKLKRYSVKTVEELPVRKTVREKLVIRFLGKPKNDSETTWEVIHTFHSFVDLVTR